MKDTFENCKPAHIINYFKIYNLQIYVSDIHKKLYETVQKYFIVL